MGLSIESFRLCSSFYSMNTFYDSKIYSIKYYKRNITKIFFIPADSGKNYFIATIFLCIIYLLVHVIRISVFIIFLSRTISFRFSSLALTRPNKIFIEFGGIVVFVFLLISLLILRIYISISYWAWGASQPFLDVHLVNKSNWVIEVIAVFMLVLPLVIYLYI